MNYKHFSLVNRYLIRRQFYSNRSISNILKDTKVGDTATVKGWIKALRKQKDNIFIDLSDGLSEQKLQIIIPKEIYNKQIGTGASLNVSGTINISPNGQKELHVSQVDVYGECVVADGFPFAPRKHYAPEYVRQYLHFRPKTSKFGSLLRVRNAATLAIHNYYNADNYILIHTPILTSNDSEGAGEIFKVVPDNINLLKSMVKEDVPVEEAFFDKKAFLTVSGQLHLEAVVHGLSKVYTFGPTFRAENSRTRLHLSEFYMLEAEIAFLDRIENLISEIEKLIKDVTKCIVDTSENDIAECREDKKIDLPWLDKKFTIMQYTDAVNILEQNRDKLKESYISRNGLSKEHEVFLVNYNGGVPVFVVDWPKEMKAFYMRECDYDSSKVSGLDLLVPDVGEMVGGSLREHDYDKLKGKLPTGSDFGWYLELRKFGGVPTGGYGLGFERYLMLLLGIKSTKDVIPFPRWPHNCAL